MIIGRTDETNEKTGSFDFPALRHFIYCLPKGGTPKERSIHPNLLMQANAERIIRNVKPNANYLDKLYNGHVVISTDVIDESFVAQQQQIFGD